MIFVTVGSDRYPFDRLVAAVEESYSALALQCEIIFQYGSCRAVPSVGRAEKFLPFRQVRQLVERADVIITHAGVGSIGLCLCAGKKPIVLAREPQYGEVIDDHQVLYAEHMARQNCIQWIRKVDDLQHALTQGLKQVQAFDYQSGERTKLCAFLNEVCS